MKCQLYDIIGSNGREGQGEERKGEEEGKVDHEIYNMKMIFFQTVTHVHIMPYLLHCTYCMYFGACVRTYHIKGSDSACHEESGTECSAELSRQSCGDSLTLNYGTLY